MRITIKDRLKNRISASKSKVFMRSDFSKLGAYSQVGRALKALVRETYLVKMGHGVYVKAEKSYYTGNPIPTAFVTEVALEVMKKMGIKADVGYFQRLYRDGKSTQIPMRDVIAVSKKVTRKIMWGKREIIYEKY